MDFRCYEKFSSDVRAVWKFSYESTETGFTYHDYDFFVGMCMSVRMCAFACVRYLRFSGEISTVVIGNDIIGISNIRDMRSNDFFGQAQIISDCGLIRFTWTQSIPLN